MDYADILNVMMWIVASGVALVVGSSMVLLFNSFQNHEMNVNVRLNHNEYDEFYDASDLIQSENIGEMRCETK